MEYWLLKENRYRYRITERYDVQRDGHRRVLICGVSRTVLAHSLSVTVTVTGYTNAITPSDLARDASRGECTHSSQRNRRPKQSYLGPSLRVSSENWLVALSALTMPRIEATVVLVLCLELSLDSRTNSDGSALPATQVSSPRIVNYRVLFYDTSLDIRGEPPSHPV